MIKTTKVITPPTAKDLTTVEAVGLELSLEANEIARVPSLIRQASSMISNYVNQPLARQQWQETYTYEMGDDYENFQTFLLSGRPIYSLDSIADYYGNLFDLTTVDYDQSAGMVHLGIFSRRAIITYTFGYLLPGQDGRDLPDDIERAAIDTVVALWYRPERGDPAIRMDRVEGVGQTYYFDSAQTGASGIPPSAIDILDPYVQVR